MSIETLKGAVRAISARYMDREQRARRLFMEERAASMHFEREREFAIKTAISEFFQVPYSSVSFCGSAQLGFSVHKDRLFAPGVSDLDAAVVDVDLFQLAWRDVIDVTRSFTDLTPFGSTRPADVEAFQQQILRRGLIRVDAMPQSDLSRDWSLFQGVLSREHTILFKRISIGIYMNEYAFCWKQDSVLARLTRGYDAE